MGEPSSSTPQGLRFLVDREFTSMYELRQYVLDQVVHQQLSYAAGHSDRKRWYLHCRAKDQYDCPFLLTAVRRPRAHDDIYVITRVQDHTCPQIAHYNWRESQKAKSIATRHATNVEAYRQTKPAQIKSTELASHGHQISYMQAWRAKGVILQDHEGTEAGGFHRIWSLLQRATYCGNVPNDEEGNGMNCLPTVTISDEALPMKHYMKSARNPDQIVPRHTFENYIIAPSVCRLAYRSMRKIIILDGCHLKTQHQLILLVAVGLDGNGQVLPLAWSVVWSENRLNWVLFLEHLHKAFNDEEPLIDESIIITDRQKGLIPAIAEVFPKTPHFFCIYHIGNNITEEFGQGSRKLFMTAAYASTPGAFREAMSVIKDKGAEGLWEYVDAIPPDKYARFAITNPRFGQYTSNLAESINSAWLDQRRLPILQGFQALWNYIMDTFYKRRESPPKWANPRYTNWAWDIYTKQLEQSRFYYVQRSQGYPFFIAGVWRSTGGKTYTVKLQDRTCTCLEFQDLQIPCRHVLAVCKEFRLNAEDYIMDYYSTKNYKDTYQPSYDVDSPAFMHPLSLDYLEPDLELPCHPPPINRTKGRPQQKRRERGRSNAHKAKRSYKCKTCGSLNHRSTNCSSVGANLPKKQRRRAPDNRHHHQKGQQKDPIVIGSSPAPSLSSSSASSSRSQSPAMTRLTSRLSESLQVTPVAQRNREIATPVLKQARANLQARLLAITATEAQEQLQDDIYEEERVMNSEPGPSRPRPPPAPTPYTELPPPIRPLQQAPKRMGKTLLTARRPSPPRLLCGANEKGKGKAI